MRPVTWLGENLALPSRVYFWQSSGASSAVTNRLAKALLFLLCHPSSQLAERARAAVRQSPSIHAQHPRASRGVVLQHCPKELCSQARF